MKNIFEKTDRISFELSNICNLKKKHPKCPASLVKESVILPEKIVYHVLDICEKYNYGGDIAFHRYNEPGIDPRLMLFIDETRKSCRDARIFLMSNGFYYNKMLEQEFYAHGVSEISITKYPESKFDDRLNMLSSPDKNCKDVCYAPLRDITINCKGEVVLCCYDWMNMHVFGDLNNQTLPDILSSGMVAEMYEQLSSGNRILELCKKCMGSR